MGFISRLLGRQQESVSSRAVVQPGSKRQQPSSPQSGTFAPDCWQGRTSPLPAVIKLQNVEDDMESDDDEITSIRVPESHSGSSEANRSGSLGTRRRAAIDISPAAVQRLADKVAILEAADLRASLDGDGSITHKDVDMLYADMQLIHRGRSSMVYRARELRTGQRIILKAYDAQRLTPSKKTALERHLRALRAAQAVCGIHDGVVVLEKVVQNPAGTYMVMQACNGGTLIEAIANSGGKLPERQVAVKVAVPVLRTLACLHSQGIVHRDIKPEHLMIHNGTIKLGDFGNAALMNGVPAGAAAAGAGRMASMLHHHHQDAKQQQQQHKGGDSVAPAVNVTVAAGSGSGCGEAAWSSAAGADSSLGPRDVMNFRTGSIEYMAPEMLDKPTAAEVFHLVIAQGIDEDDLPTYDEKVDVWSLGVVAYEALSGLQPFLADSAADMAAVIATKMAQRQQQQQQQQEFPAFIDRLHVSKDCKEFLAACFSMDPRARPAAEVLLHHPWLIAMQEQAAAAAVSRAASRRTSMQQQRPPAGPGRAVAVSSSSLFATTGSAAAACAGAAGAAAAAAAAAAPAAAAASPGDSGPLLDPLLTSTLLNLPAHVARRRSNLTGLPEQSQEEEEEDGVHLHRTATGLFEGEALPRSQTASKLEVDVQSVLRTNTQRLGAKGVRAHVFGS